MGKQVLSEWTIQQTKPLRQGWNKQESFFRSFVVDWKKSFYRTKQNVSNHLRVHQNFFVQKKERKEKEEKEFCEEKSRFGGN